MGVRYEFKCSSCGYEAQVCDGEDAGMRAVVRTCVCRVCQELVDAVVAWVDEDPATAGGFRAVPPSCPTCDATGLVRWRPSHPCPKCGRRMEQSDAVILWD